MHTSTTEGGLDYIHDGDFSGDIILAVKESEISDIVIEGFFHVRISFDDLKEIVGSYIAQKRINFYEQVDPCALIEVIAEQIVE